MDSVLDIGCGTGGVTIPANLKAGQAGMVAGIDPSSEMIAAAQKKAQLKDLQIDFRSRVTEALPYPDASFDIVTSSLMMHHLPAHLQVTGLAEIYRVIEAGGRLLIADIDSVNMSKKHQPFDLLAMHLHRSGFQIDDLQGALTAVGFQEITHLEQRFSIIGFMRFCITQSTWWLKQE